MGDRGPERERSGAKIKSDPFLRDGYRAGVAECELLTPHHPPHTPTLSAPCCPSHSDSKAPPCQANSTPGHLSPGLALKFLLPKTPSFLQLQSGKFLLSFNHLSGIHLKNAILDTFIHPTASAGFIIPLSSHNTLCLFIAALITWYF